MTRSSCCWELSYILKQKKKQRATDWESLKTEYESITESFVKSYPMESSEKFPETNPEKKFTKSRILTKVKAIRLKYGKAIDSGNKAEEDVWWQHFDSCRTSCRRTQ